MSKLRIWNVVTYIKITQNLLWKRKWKTWNERFLKFSVCCLASWITHVLLQLDTSNDTFSKSVFHASHLRTIKQWCQCKEQDWGMGGKLLPLKTSLRKMELKSMYVFFFLFCFFLRCQGQRCFNLWPKKSPPRRSPHQERLSKDKSWVALICYFPEHQQNQWSWL